MIDLYSGEELLKIDCTSIPNGDYILIKINANLLEKNPEFYIFEILMMK